MKKKFFFSLLYIRMSGKNINFDDKKSRKAAFTKTKEYIVLTTLMLIIYQFLKKSHTVQKILTNTLSDTMIMIILDHYV